MVPSGGLLRAKMAPAGAQMGSGNLINAGIVSEGGRESRKRVKIHAGKGTEGEVGMKPGPGVRFRPAADLIHLAESEGGGGGGAGVLEMKRTLNNKVCW